MTNTHDYLAICLIGAGSSYGRSPDKEVAIANCKRSLEQDWSSLFDLDGQPATINVFDVTGHDSVYWDARGLFSKTDPDHAFDPPELRTVTLSVPKRRRR